MNEVVGKITAIGEKEQPLAVFVQPADMMQGLEGFWQQRVDRHAILLVTAAANVTARFVQGDDDAGFLADRFAIDGDLITITHQRAQVFDLATIDGHAALKNDLFRTAA
jgi:hypothetical protein